MKSLNQYITEKLKVSKNQYNYCPKTREELDDLLNQLLKERGWEADLNDIDTSNITDMSNLFTKRFEYNFTDFNGDISEWDVSNVTNMNNMFGDCINFNSDLSKWDVSNVANMDNMFCGCKSFEGKGLENWKFAKIKDLNGTFANCYKFTGKSIENWNMENIRCIDNMFYCCLNFNPNLSNWRLPKLFFMQFTFAGCKKFEGKGLENWGCKNITDMSNAFNSCYKLNCDLSSWSLDNAIGIDYDAFKKCPLINEKNKWPKYCTNER